MGDDSTLLRDITAAVLQRGGGPEWTVGDDATWARVTPPGTVWPEQGWKLHVSATLLAAPVTLSRVAEVVVAEGCPFKYAKDLVQLRTLLSSSVERGAGGKFITVYPLDGAQFHRLAQRLHEVTEGLPGPAVLSDRPVTPGSLVSYRYGGFSPSTVFTNEGAFVPMLTAPDGSRVPDPRNAWFSPPPWAEPPLPAPPPASAGSVLLDDRYVVRKAIRHSYKGGVYRALDQRTGAEVVIKQARPHVMAALDGTDARDRLRHEADMLDRLAPLGLAPRKVSLFTQQDNVFLAQEAIPGESLTAWAGDRVVGAWRGAGPPVPEAVAIARDLVRLLAAVHAEDLVLRDLTPNNVMISDDPGQAVPPISTGTGSAGSTGTTPADLAGTGSARPTETAPAGRLRLVDLELAVPAGTRVWRTFTIGYAAPEIVNGPPMVAATKEADRYSLGATILHLASGRRPLAMPDEDRTTEFVAAMGRTMPAVRALAPLILGLTHGGWTLDQAVGFLADVSVPEPPEPSTVDVDRLLSDGFSHVVASMTPSAKALWRSGEVGPRTDPLNVQHGAAGVLGVLTRAGHRDAVAQAARWIDDRLFDIPRILPGLHFGRAGTAWALHDAAVFMEDDKLAARALELADRLPLTWPNPDVCHGASGTGLALVHLWQQTGDPALLERVVAVADGVMAAAREREGQLLWPVPGDFDSYFAGAVHYGFAHGVAGNATFLLLAGVAAQRREYQKMAERAGRTLLAVANLEDDGAWWPSGFEHGSARERLLHWCSGSAGVGTFLIRLWAVTGATEFRTLAEAGARAVRRDQWHSNTAACHGLAGHGEFLLDLAAHTGDTRYHDWAAELAGTLQAQRTVRSGQWLVPDESGSDVTAGYNAGSAGILGFLHRLRHGGPRWWLPELTTTREEVRG